MVIAARRAPCCTCSSRFSCHGVCRTKLEQDKGAKHQRGARIRLRPLPLCGPTRPSGTLLERRRVPDRSAMAAIDYSLGNWRVLTRHLDDGSVPLDNSFLDRQIKPWQMGRKNWLFAGSELAGQRAAVVVTLVRSARFNGHEP